MLFFFSLFASILVQYFIIITCKNIMSYNEELFLFTIYISLFIIILNLIPTIIKNYILKESFNLIEFYEKFFYLKLLLLLKIKKFYLILLKKEILKYIIYKLYLFLQKNKLLLHNIVSKFHLEFLSVVLYFLEKILIKKNQLKNYV